MRRLLLFIAMLGATLSTSAQGWPENYGGVMLQGFYWDSYDETQWTALTAQADELSQYFQLIWVPNSGKTSDFYHTGRQTMGYDPCFWLDHTSCFGTESELKAMIAAFKTRGTGIIEDVVINHKNGLSTWVDFPNESKNGYTLTWDNTNYSGICKTDECNKNGYPTTGAADTGDDFAGYRDLDHTNAQVQENVKTYLSFLQKELGYTGFRYDMVKGFGAKYVGIYNAASQPSFSVGEYWDGSASKVRAWIDGTKTDGVIQSAAFDFPLKYYINRAFQKGNWSQLGNASLVRTSGYSRYAVTFVDNHDTDKNPSGNDDGPLAKNVCAANAYILSMPGTPCLFLRHWTDYRGSLKKLILARRIAGITNQSSLLTYTSSTTGLVVNTQGTNGKVLLLLGSATASTSGYQLAVEGDAYKLYLSNGLDISAIKAVTDADQADLPVTVPAFCTRSENEVCAFFEAPSTWTSDICCWAWTSSPADNFTYAERKNWPGTTCTLLGTADNGNKVWKWTWDGKKQNNTAATQPAYIIFSNSGSPQTADLNFTNGGYYTREELKATVSVTAIAAPPTVSGSEAPIFDLTGRRVDGNNLKPGIYIVGGKKKVMR